MNLRSLTIDDYPQVIAFWKANYLLTKLDEFGRVKLFLEKNPGLSVIAEEKGEIIGTALGSFDGRRGTLQKVVVKKDQRGKGIGGKIVREAVKRIQTAGALDIRFNTVEELVHFYESCGFTKDSRPSMILKVF
jgi:ribosomal protein S18 acetylase RimI-like enzyme